MLAEIVAADHAVARLLNAWAAEPWAFNRLVVLLSEANFLKMAPFLALIVWGWSQPRHRRAVVGGLAALPLAFLAGRALQLVLPPRLRPLHDPSLGLVPPAGLTPEILGGWSAFPSDHAALFAALAGMVFALSRPAGFAALAYAVAAVIAPRVYIGVHFLSDVLAGMAIGGAAAWLGQRAAVTGRLAPPLERLAARHPACFNAAAVLFLAELGQMFADLRGYAAAIGAALSPG